MRLHNALVALAAIAAPLALGQYLIDELSFGHAGRFVISGNTRLAQIYANSIPRIDAQSGAIPNFQISGSPQPQLLSNKIVLTPPGLRNSRASVWGSAALNQPTWTADVDFRATGPERAGGNLNIWLVRDGESVVGTASVYTAKKFEGLALVVNSHAGAGGMVRGFLNDGTVDFSSRPTVDELAFGHCQYSYRNLGRPSQIKLRQGAEGFAVEIDGKLCFSTDKFSIPTGYKFGVTAATPENPDSFELFKMVVMSGPAAGFIPPAIQNNQLRGSRQDRARDNTLPNGQRSNQNNDYQNNEKLASMDNKLQELVRHLLATVEHLDATAAQSESRHAEMTKMILDLNDEVRRLAGIEADLGIRVTNMEKEVKSLKAAIHTRAAQSEHVLKDYLSDSHSTLSETVLDHVRGKHLRMIFVVILSQAAWVMVYVLWRRYKRSGTKKYL